MDRKGEITLLQICFLVFGFISLAFSMGRVNGLGMDPFTDEEVNAIYEDGLESSSLNVPSSGWMEPFTDEEVNAIYEDGLKDTNLDVPSSGWTGEIMDHPDSAASGFFKMTPGGWASSLASGVEWAAGAYYIGTMVGDMFGMSEDNSEALGIGMAAGAGIGKALSVYKEQGMFAKGKMLNVFGSRPELTGLGIGAIVFVAMYKDVETKVVTFSCMPWQAPNGGDSCEVCNDDSLPCSEYRCKSLGQSCEIVNAGTADEKCVYVNPRDVSPPVIKPNYDELSAGHDYKNVKLSPPGPGFEIVNLESRDGCLKAFSPLEFGLVTDEPAQCKIDFNHTTSFDDMSAYFGGSNLYSYNHSERFSLPGASELSGSGFVLTNGKDMTLRCRRCNVIRRPSQSVKNRRTKAYRPT